MENKMFIRLLLIIIIVVASLLGFAILAGEFENVRVFMGVIGIVVCAGLIGKALYWLLLKEELED